MKSPNTKWLDKAKGKLCLAVFLFLLILITSSFLMRLQEYQSPQLLSIVLDTLPSKKIARFNSQFTLNDGMLSQLKSNDKPIWNFNVINSKEKDEISLFVFEENDKIDTILTKRIKSEFLKKNYTITDEIIYYDAITPEIANKLKSGKIDFFNGNLYKCTDYIYIGIVSYEFEPNFFRRDLIDCTMQINYYIYSASTGVIMFSENDKLIGSGQTKKLAKLSAIQSFIL